MMESKDLPIGVFDSGMGGLTVLRALRVAMPQESFIYLGDTARLPYGTKSVATVEQYAVQMSNILVEKGIKALVIACNTATMAALAHLQSALHYMPVIGVIRPGARAAVEATKQKKIGVLATETTIASGAYQNTIHAYLPEAEVYTQAGSLLVALAEEGMVDNAIVEETFHLYLKNFHALDTLVLGCTHFPVFKDYLEKRIGDHTTIVDSASATAKAVREALAEKGLFTTQQHRPTQFLVTDSVDRFQRVGQIFLCEPLAHKNISLIDI